MGVAGTEIMAAGDEAVEHFMDHPERRPLGEVIRIQNEQSPGWVGRIIRSKVQGTRWAIPGKLLTWRFAGLRGTPRMRSAKNVLVATAATGLNILPCILANRALHAEGAEAFKKADEGTEGKVVLDWTR